jgi:NAD(P)-dependent dehydrogenase (short-subunit alcohol dehydrogenase family)
VGKLDGKVAIVTGGGRGIGRAIAQGYACEGARVVVTAARKKQEIDSFAKQWGAKIALAILADVTDPSDCAHVVEETIRCFGQIDVLVNNAGRGMLFVGPYFLTQPTRFWEIDPATWRIVIDTNVNGPFLMARAVVPHMLSRGTGAIINITMNYETMKRRGFSPYGPSKAALESETIIWAKDLEGTGVTVNEILPGGATATGMIPPQIPEEIRHALLSAEIIVPPAVYLASDDGRKLTGRRLVAKDWMPECPDGTVAEDGYRQLSKR